MISSLYTIGYFAKLGALLDEEQIPYYETPINVPGGSASDFMDYLAKKEIINRNRKPNDPVLVIGWDKGTTNRRSEAHPFKITRISKNNEFSASSRHAIQGMFTLSVFCICNKGNLVEDLEEIYSTKIRPRTTFNIDAHTVFELDTGEFGANMLHSEISSVVLNPHGNIWGVSWSVNLFGEIVNLIPDDAVKCKKLSVELYENNLNLRKFISKIQFVKPEPEPNLEEDPIDDGRSDSNEEP